MGWFCVLPNHQIMRCALPLLAVLQLLFLSIACTQPASLSLSNGRKIPRLGFGTAGLGGAWKTASLVEFALKQGLRLVDTAQVNRGSLLLTVSFFFSPPLFNIPLDFHLLKRQRSGIRKRGLGRGSRLIWIQIREHCLIFLLLRKFIRAR